MGSAVLAPCPISEFGATSVTCPFGAMLMKALGANSAAAAGVLCAATSELPKRIPTTSPPPARPVSLRKERRFRVNEEAGVFIGAPQAVGGTPPTYNRVA